MIRSFQWDLARQVERLDWLIAQLPRYAAWGYHEVHLHLEDAVEYPRLPGVARRDAYSYKQFGRLVDAAARAGLKVVPIVNLLGHTQYLIKVPELRDLNELRAPDGSPLERGQICPLHPRTLEVAEKLLRDMAPFCTAGKVHVGLDESFHLGKHPLSRREVAEIGLGAHFARHVGRLRELTKSLGLEMGMWADMLYFLPEAIPLLPRGLIAYDWYYYPFGRHPRVEFFNFAERDLVPALRRQGIAYFGCPMNGAFRHEPLPVFGDRLANLRSWWRRCQTVKAEGLLVTSWEAYRLAIETTTVVDAAAASLWLEPGKQDDAAMIAAGLARVYPKIGRSSARPRTLARTLLAADGFAFAGYARWQINDRWDTFAGTEDLAPCRAEERFFRRQRANRAWPAPLAASLAFRHYLAQRDVFVRHAAREVLRLRGSARVVAGLRRLQRDAADFAVAVRAGRKAARAMWRRTRDPSLIGQNEALLATDAQRLAAWRAWLKHALRQPALLHETTPVCGVWQLHFLVHHVRPAVQKIVAERQASDGGWHELGARFTIEFRAEAARPTSRVTCEFSVPVDDPEARLRIAVRGVGQVAISDVTLINGPTTRRDENLRGKTLLGRRAPSRGLPEIDWSRNVAVQPLRFTKQSEQTLRFRNTRLQPDALTASSPSISPAS